MILETNFIDRVVGQVRSKQSHVVVGLDPHLDLLPSQLGLDLRAPREHIAEVISRFCSQVLLAVRDVAVAVKPQVAFFERLGGPGLSALEDIVKQSHELGLLVISDCKRGDIGSTAVAYAEYHLGSPLGNPPGMGADAMTVNPYLGPDSLAPLGPFIAEGKGAFVLAKTSNPGSWFLQDQLLHREGQASVPVFEVAAETARQVGKDAIGNEGYSAVGIVVGATHPDQAALLRGTFRDLYFLVPGYGAQGATAKEIVTCFSDNGLGAVVNASRSIIFAYRRPEHEGLGSAKWAEACRLAAETMRDEINAELRNAGRLAWSE